MEAPRPDAPDRTPGQPPALTELPPFPAVALRAMQMTSNGETSLRQLHDVIRTDQAFSSELLRIANCPLYGIRAQIKSTLQAAMLLGFKRIKAVVLTIGMRAYLGPSLSIPAIHACWRHSLATATLTEELAKASFQGTRDNASIAGSQENSANPILDKDVAYTAGMIHDLGRLALAVARPQQYAELLRTAEDRSRDILECEREAFGMDHCEAGLTLGRAWHLPQELLEVMFRHHAPMDESHFDLVAAVHLGCRMADALGFTAGGCVKPASWEEIISEFPERERQYFNCGAEDMTQAVRRAIEALEPV
jgi:HD-like signal output (HDOD) protein